MYWFRRLEKFHESEIHKKHQDTHTGLTIRRTRFREFIYPYIEEPTSESCVDIPMLALSEIIVFIGTTARKIPNLKSSLE